MDRGQDTSCYPRTRIGEKKMGLVGMKTELMGFCGGVSTKW